MAAGLSATLYNTQQCVYVNPNLLIHPTPLNTPLVSGPRSCYEMQPLYSQVGPVITFKGH